MRKITATLLALVLLPMAGCGERSLTEAELRAMLEAEVTQEILAFEYGDYDGDGVFEAFAFVGAEEGGPPEGVCGALWFINAKGAQELEVSQTGYWGLINVYAFGENKFAVMNQYATTGGYVSVWGVHKGKPRRENISGVGGGMRQMNDTSFTLWHSTYDFDVTDGVSTGHTWKNYWFYWDGKAFHEYGGVKITEVQLRKCGGAADILDAIQAKGEGIGEIYYRGNGIINVNHSRVYDSSRGNSYTILQLSDAKLTAVEVEDNSGFYLPALAPGIATYPELPEIFN